ncbi:MAG: L,D-transpeptidase family protein [Gammaproteobacteria bacterium]|nr:L,D-transpeptidase family protein [Gammaproteobacteria bacterium]
MGRVIIFLLLSVAGSGAGAANLIASHTRLHELDPGQEAILVKALHEVSASRVNEALSDLRGLLAANPGFRLAQMVYADLLLSRAGPISEFGAVPFASHRQVEAFRDEARVRLRHYSAPPPADQIPSALVMLSAEQKYAVVVNMTTSRLFLYENRGGEPYLAHDFYATIGKNGTGKFSQGDQKTPVGVYFVTGVIEPDRLPDFYGSGAFPIDYPNAWDQRHGRTGYGIWLHGTPSNTFSRPPRDSDGCVILSNADLENIKKYITPGETPVILADGIQWVSRAEWRKQREAMAGIVEQWRRDWESRDTDRYLGHYSPAYAGLGMDYEAWVAYKRKVNNGKRYIRVALSGQSMFLYPGERSLLVVTFRQDYASDRNQRRFTKRQYWKQEADGRWRILYEGSVS